MRNNPSRAVKNLACCAMLVAVSVVMARVFSFSATGIRWSLDKFPLFLAGMLFGPVLGAFAGFSADFIGSLMQFGFNPFLCPPAILYGLFGGLFQRFLVKKFSGVRLAAAYALPVVIGSVLYQSCALAWFYFDGAYLDGLLFYLGSRSIQFAIMLVAETFILYTLIKLKVFTRLGLWPPIAKRGNKNDCQ